MLILRNVLAVLLGFVAGSLVNVAILKIGYHIVPPAPGVNPNDVDSLAASGAALTAKDLIFPFLAHALGTFVGALSAHVIAASRRTLFAYAVSVLFLAGGIAASFMIPAPAWFIALDLVLAYLPMAWLATQVAQALKPARPPAPAPAREAV